MAAITTIGSKVRKATEFINLNNVFMGLGKSTPWEDDDNPPSPERLAKALIEPIGYKQVTTKVLVVPDTNGEFVTKDGKFRQVAFENAYDENACWVYVELDIDYAELPLGWYRQIGLFTGLTRAAGVEPGKVALLPTEVESAGILEVLDNRKPSSRLEDQRETISLVIEF